MSGFNRVDRDRRNGRTQPPSYLDTLQQAKQLFLKENFNAAKICFEEVGRLAFATAPDLGIDATYGLAECQRLERDFSNAVENYKRLLQFGCSRRSFKGRFEESNRIAIIQSFLALVDIGRLSLRVPTSLLEEFLNYGFRWTSQEVGEDAASLSFGLARLMLKRNILGPEFVLDRMVKLLKTLKGDNREWLPIDHVIVELKLLETKLDARLLDEVPNNPSPNHPAYLWASTFSRLLCVRRSLMIGDFESAQLTLGKIPEAAESFQLYPELLLLRLSLSSEMTLSDDTTRNYLDKICEGVIYSLKKIGDLSTPFWHLLNFLRLHITSLKTANVRVNKRKELHQNLLFKALSLLQDLLHTHWLLDVLLSREISHSTISRIKLWSQTNNHSNEWLEDANTHLDILAKAVRP